MLLVKKVRKIVKVWNSARWANHFQNRLHGCGDSQFRWLYPFLTGSLHFPVFALSVFAKFQKLQGFQNVTGTLTDPGLFKYNRGVFFRMFGGRFNRLN